jgi:hypothetical protein
MLRKLLTLLTLVAIFPVAACDDGTSVGEPGLISLMLTDAAGDFTQAQVKIDSIQLVGDGAPITLRDEAITTDLLTLSNDVESLVEDAVVPAGTYTSIRFVIPEACIGVEQEGGGEMVYASSGFEACGAADGALQIPSFGESGLKVGLPDGSWQVDGDSKVVLLDFDVSQSFGQEAGSSDMWVMNPVIKADDFGLSGTIVVELTAAGGVDPIFLADFQAELSTDAEPQAFTDDDDDGVYTVMFEYLLPDQSYDVSVGLQEGASYDFTLDPESPQSVSLGSGEQATVAFEATLASGS